MKHISRIFILVTILAVAGFGIYHFLPPSQAGQRAVEQLAGVHMFSLGPVGIAGSIPEREDQFFVILSSRHSSRLFCDLYEHGTPEAKLYALCGLRLSHGDFDGYAGRFVREVSVVDTQGGCIGNQHSSAEAVTAIRQGVIEQYLPLRREYEKSHKPAA
jgi:hypothetical protein